MRFIGNIVLQNDVHFIFLSDSDTFKYMQCHQYMHNQMFAQKSLPILSFQKKLFTEFVMAYLVIIRFSLGFFKIIEDDETGQDILNETQTCE
jgi:hypothetical protein